jgi:hypothetical protein
LIWTSNYEFCSNSSVLRFRFPRMEVTLATNIRCVPICPNVTF